MTYAEGKVAIKALETNGWQHICTIMSDQEWRKETKEYGMLFTKTVENSLHRFWLNKDTYKELPS